MRFNHPSFRSVLVTLITSGMMLASSARLVLAKAPTAVWLEGESATFIPASLAPRPEDATDSSPVKIEASGHPDFLSGQKWLRLQINANKVTAQVPAEGIILSYLFNEPKAGNCDLWDRVGFESARSPFDWRVDGGEWKTVGPEELTSDAMELSFFCEVAWLKLGTQPLAAGPHKLEIRLKPGTDAKGKPVRLLYASDALCIAAAGIFTPYSHFHPGEDYRTETDKQAERTLFKLPAFTTAFAGERSAVKLDGLWQICRDDEQLPGPVDVPIAALPVTPRWSAISVPSDKQTARPDLVLAHRVWYRTRVEVPQEAMGHSFILSFPQNSLNTTVYMNGMLCGFSDTPFAHLDFDVTKVVKAGVNELWVGIRDPYYAFYNDPKDPMVLRKMFHLPPQVIQRGFSSFVYPIHGTTAAGILQTPILTAAGPVYASDVFVKPSVAKKALAVEVSLSNPGTRGMAVEVTCEAMDAKTGALAITLPKVNASIPAGGSQTVRLQGPWADAKLWWPDAPNLYNLRTTTRVGGKVVDMQTTRFGFREWSIKGKDFLLNGVVWHGWADTFTAPTKEAWLECYKKNHMTLTRLMGPTQGGVNPFYGMSPDAALDFFDENGVVVRRCGPLDGEIMNYKLPAGPTELGRKWKEQMLAQIKGERNHPSIQIWSIENEFNYVNVFNSGKSNVWEPITTEVSNAVRALDPTRPTMIDGGGATKADTLPVHGDHYVKGDLTKYPGLAYGPQVDAGGRKRWVWDQQRPRYIGEDFYLAGNHPELSTLGGEAAFGGKAASLPAAGLLLRIAQQGYRWADFGAWHFWLGQHDSDTSYYHYFAPRLAMVKEWDWTFASGASVPRTVGLFNDTHSAEPLTFTWNLIVGGKKVAGESKPYDVAPGTHLVVPVSLPMPKVTARTEGELKLTVAAGGTELWSDTKAVSVLPPAVASGAAALGNTLLLFDPANTLGGFLARQHIAFTRVTDLKSLPRNGRLLLVAKDAIDKAASTSTELAVWALPGRSVVVLEQQNPLRYQALPCEMDVAANEGCVGFAEDLNHPVFTGLAQKDFFTWNADQLLYRNAYVKPARGAKSLFQCDLSLKDSAVVEVPCGKGLFLLSQLLVGEKLASNPVAQTLLVNMLNYAASYKQVFAPASLVADSASPFAKAVEATGLQYSKPAGPLEAISQKGSIVVLQATPENLKILAANLPKVREFTGNGGWLVLNGLTPEGLESYNKLVGIDHMIRPYGSTKPTLTKDGSMAIERVRLAAPRNPLTAGLSSNDVTLYSSKKIFGFQGGCYALPDEFSYVVDLDDVAPFATSSFPHFGNITNGFTNADGWPLIINFPVPANGSPFPITLKFPKLQTIREFTWLGNTTYYPITRVSLVFDGDTAHPVVFDIAPTAEAQVLEVNPPRKASEVALNIEKWNVVPNKAANIGIDNIYLRAERPADFARKVHPMLNIGAMVEYPQGKGGVVLCNVNFTASEGVPANAVSKQNILAAVLRNLHAPFGEGKAVIVGAGLACDPVDISKYATQFRTERGWFGDAKFTFDDLPTGKVKLAGVNYDIFDFPTSPVPTVLMLKGPGPAASMPKEITGIPVNRTADALFFLQTAKMGSRRKPNEAAAGLKREMFHYAVHYADGKTVNIPVNAEIDIENYKQEKEVHIIPGAQVAWTAPYTGTPFVAVAYSMQWTNPWPAVPIATVDMVSGNEKLGTPVLLALTAAKTK